MVAQKLLSSMSALMDELIESHLLADDDEEADEGWLDDHHQREKSFLNEAISDGLDKYPDFNAINNLPPNCDPDIARDAGQLKEVLTKCAIGATEFKEKFPRAHLERMVKRDLEMRFKKDQKYTTHVREDVPGSYVKKYGSRSCTSSKGTFVNRLRERRRIGRATHWRVDARRQGSYRPRGMVASVWLPAENREPELAASLRDHGAKRTSKQLPTPSGKAGGHRRIRPSLADESGRPRRRA